MWARPSLISLKKRYLCTKPSDCDRKEKRITGRGGRVIFLCNWWGYCRYQDREKRKR